MSILSYITEHLLIEGLSITSKPDNFKKVWNKWYTFTIDVDGEDIPYRVSFELSCSNKLIDVSFDERLEGSMPSEDTPQTNRGKPFKVFNGVGYAIVEWLKYFEESVDECPVYIISFINFSNRT